MTKQEFIEQIENMPDEANIFIEAGYINLIEADSVNYDSDQNIIVINYAHFYLCQMWLYR